MSSRRRVWIHRTATVICVLLAIPAVIWWKHSILFVILLSLATQAWTSFGAAEAADNRELRKLVDQLQRSDQAIEAKLDELLELRRSGRA